MHAITKSKQRGHEFEGEWRGVYGWSWLVFTLWPLGACHPAPKLMHGASSSKTREVTYRVRDSGWREGGISLGRRNRKDSYRRTSGKKSTGQSNGEGEGKRGVGKGIWEGKLKLRAI